MKNKTVKLIVATLMILVIASLSTVSLCSGINLNQFGGNTNGAAANTVTNMSNQIIGVIQIIGVAVAVVMLIWLAIKYISAAPSEKADIKKSATIYVVGAVLLFGSVGVLQIIKNFTTDAGLTNVTTKSPTNS